MKSVPSSELLALYVSNNDQEAFRELYDRHSPCLMGFLVNQVQENDAGDLLQEVFICMMRLHHTYEAGTCVGTWLMAIARSRVQTFHRSANRLKRRPKEGIVRITRRRKGYRDNELQITAPTDAAGETALLVREMVSRLPEHERRPVELVYLEQVEYAEAADQLGLPLGTLKSRLTRAIKKMGEWMNAQPHESNLPLEKEVCHVA